MTMNFFAQPYDISASGFFFESSEQFERRASDLRNQYGEPVEEFEIQVIDGCELDVKCFEVIGIHQGNIHEFITRSTEWCDQAKINLIIAVGDCGYDFDIMSDDPYQFDTELHEVDSLKELAHEFFDDGLFGSPPAELTPYIDYDAIARDLSFDYSMIKIAGQRYAYRCY